MALTDILAPEKNVSERTVVLLRRFLTDNFRGLSSEGKRLGSSFRRPRAIRFTSWKAVAAD